jgi:aryl-alcohol dehydrogenase-like predicted oxidoreductase
MMQYSNFGNTGLIVSRMAFGAMTFGQGTLIGELKNDIDQNMADQMVGMCLDAGINFFDTADMYTTGQSEIMLGKALKSRRDDVVIATKCGFRSGDAITSSGLSYRYILKAAAASLRRLDTDYIDLFLVHIPDPMTPLEETARALDDVVKKGWVRYVGYSNYPAWKAQKMLSIQDRDGRARWIGAQMYYSLLGRDLENDVVPFLKDTGLGRMVWSPLASGFLSGKYTRENPVPAGSRRAKFDFPPVNIEKGYEVVAKLKALGEKYEASVAQLALAWLLARPFVSSVIVGATKTHQLEDNLAAARIKIAAEDVQILDDLTAPAVPYPAWMQPMGWDEKVKAALEA